MKTLKDLQADCEFLGVSVAVPSPKKQDYINAIQAHFMGQNYPEGVPVALAWRCAYSSPMLCAKLAALAPADQDELWGGEEWWFQEMLEGTRVFLCYHWEQGFSAYGRGLEEDTLLPQEHVFPFIADASHEALEELSTFLLDCIFVPGAAVDPRTPGTFYPFDLLKLGDQETCELPLYKRHKAVLGLTERLLQAGGSFKLLRTVQDPPTKRQWFADLVDSGAKGIVAKRRDSLYRAMKARSASHWVKITPSDAGEVRARGVNGVLGYTSSLDGSTLVFSAGQAEIARIAVPSPLLRQIVDREQLQLAPWAEGLVAELDGKLEGPLLKEARIMRWRDDKSPADCEVPS